MLEYRGMQFKSSEEYALTRAQPSERCPHGFISILVNLSPMRTGNLLPGVTYMHWLFYPSF